MIRKKCRGHVHQDIAPWVAYMMYDLRRHDQENMSDVA
jgi:hypothetical protein